MDFNEASYFVRDCPNCDYEDIEAKDLDRDTAIFECPICHHGFCEDVSDDMEEQAKARLFDEGKDA